MPNGDMLAVRRSGVIPTLPLKLAGLPATGRILRVPSTELSGRPPADPGLVTAPDPLRFLLLTGRCAPRRTTVAASRPAAALGPSGNVPRPGSLDAGGSFLREDVMDRFRGLVGGIAGMAGATLASLCCLLPLTVVVLGLGSGAFMATTMVYRWLFIPAGVRT